LAMEPWSDAGGAVALDSLNLLAADHHRA